MKNDQTIKMLVSALHSVQHSVNHATAIEVATLAVAQWTNGLTPATINQDLRDTFKHAGDTFAAGKLAVVKHYREHEMEEIRLTLTPTELQRTFEDCAFASGIRRGMLAIDTINNRYCNPFVQFAWIDYQAEKGVN